MSVSAARPSSSIVPVLAAGLAATLLGVGLQRFAYSPLLPAMVHGGWLSAGAAGALGAANLGGYLAGAMAATTIGRRFGMVRAVRGSMLLAILCFVLCAIRGDVWWFLPWRVIAGVTGAILMVLAGPAVQAAMPAARRGLGAGVVMMGPGIGIVASAVLVPAVLPAGLPATWLALAAAAVLLTALAWRRFPDAPLPPFGRLAAGGAGRLVAAYALIAAAAAPQMQWWPDFFARGLGWGARAGGLFWLLYGIAAVAGATASGRLADRIGAARALVVVCVLLAVSLIVPLVTINLAALVLATLLGGAVATGCSVLALTRARDIAGPASPQVWKLCTAAWGLAQTVAGFGLAWLYTRTGSHLPLFATGAGLALLAIPFAIARDVASATE